MSVFVHQLPCHRKLHVILSPVSHLVRRIKAVDPVPEAAQKVGRQDHGHQGLSDAHCYRAYLWWQAVSTCALIISRL